MKSPGGNYQDPGSPAPPAHLIRPQGQTAVAAPPQQSFLPSDPNAMATGLTPEMMAAIEAAPTPQVQQPAAAASPAASGFKTTPQAQFLLAMGVNPKLLFGDKYDAWASQPVSRGDLAMQMMQGGGGRSVGGSGRGDGGGASTTGGFSGAGGRSSARSGGLY
jgi:uncharacterized membrane protein YgcG